MLSWQECLHWSQCIVILLQLSLFRNAYWRWFMIEYNALMSAAFTLRAVHCPEWGDDCALSATLCLLSYQCSTWQVLIFSLVANSNSMQWCNVSLMPTIVTVKPNMRYLALMTLLMWQRMVECNDTEYIRIAGVTLKPVICSAWLSCNEGVVKMFLWHLSDWDD